MDGMDALSIANAAFARRLRLVTADDWERPTPCEEWDVRALVNHVIGGNHRYTMLLHGASAHAVNATRSLDHLGDDPVDSFVSSAAEVTAAFGEHGALGRNVHHPAGDRSGADLVGMRVLDVAVHGWDLARAIGADETLEPDVVEFVLALSPGFERSRQQGAFRAPVAEASPDAPPQVRLLQLLGRRPST
jgi:uncharacterized protein (TIGR03086 family)